MKVTLLATFVIVAGNHGHVVIDAFSFCKRAVATNIPVLPRGSSTVRTSTISTTLNLSSEQPITEDCGCSPPIIYSGKPSLKAKSINPRESIAGSQLITLDGELVSMNKMLPLDDTVSIVVFLRSFG